MTDRLAEERPQSAAAGQLGERQPPKNMAQPALYWHDGEFRSGPLSGTDFLWRQTYKQTESVHYSKIIILFTHA